MSSAILRRIMNIKAVSICLVLSVVGCNGTGTVTNGQAKAPRYKSAYPHLGLVTIYDGVIETMAGKVFKGEKERSRKHKAALLAYIRKVQPFEEFEADMLRKFELLKKGRDNEKLRETEEYRSEFTVCANVSMAMAMMLGSNCIDVYMRKHVHPDKLTAGLFKLSDNYDDDVTISWIGSEVTIGDFNKAMKTEIFQFQKGDRIYSYNSQPFSWKQMFGRRGYAVFRDGKLIERFITMMN
ncbi:unnamed protein product [marine sediment metagenome]|uniref:Lipoprotein n=1 Tax=marine sediment metagenome TaxID=412755 RepID=X0UJV6_9ZZZZ